MYITRQPGAPATPLEKLSPWEVFSREQSECCARYLLSRAPSDLLVKDSFGYSLLHRACLRGDLLVVAALLKTGVPPDLPIGDGIGAVHLASGRGQVAILCLLFQAGACLNQQDWKGRIPLHYAAEHNQVLAIAWLLQFPQAGRPDTPDLGGVTPLHLACASGSALALNYMLRCKDSAVGASEPPLNFAACDFLGNTCLHAAFTPCRANYNIRKQTHVTWILLNCDRNTASPALQLVQMKNHAGEKPLDLARKSGARMALIWMLMLSEFLLEKSGPNSGHKWFKRIYTGFWLFAAFAPLIIAISGCLMNMCFSTHLFYIPSIFIILWLFNKQWHRMDDGSNRANPFFLGSFLTGISATLYAFVRDFRFVVVPLYFYIFLFSFFLVFILFLSLFFLDPGRARRPITQDTLANLTLCEVSGIHEQFFADSISNTTSRQKVLDRYCPHCDLVPEPHSSVKHCNLCTHCMVNMDHHCLFIMQCVTKKNQRLFVWFLFVVCLFTGLFLGCTIWTLFTYCSNLSSSFSFTTLVDFCLYMYMHFPRSVVVFPVDLFIFLWVLKLLSEQSFALTLSTHRQYPLRYRRTSLFRQCKLIFQSLVLNKIQTIQDYSLNSIF